MCDTMVSITPDGVLFAKNSDRDANEAQLLEWHPSIDHAPGARVRTTYLEIAQVPHTHAVLLSRPWWMFGAEMGANEHGVVIGNEAVYTTEPDGPEALLGMDMVRLALERADSAESALALIVNLLETHGQGGACSAEREGYTYHNSFLIADPTGAFVLETAGRHWASEQVRGRARSISNGLTIPGFAELYERRSKGRLNACATRRSLTETGAATATGPLGMMATLREHGGAAPHWSVANGTLNAPCVHAGGLKVSSQTTGSLVADLRDGQQLWVTGTSSPCTSVFKPVRVDDHAWGASHATNRFDPSVAWWRHELLHRAMMADYGRWHPQFATERDALEASWVESPPNLAAAFVLAENFEKRWTERIGVPTHDTRPRFVRRLWREIDSDAALPSWTSRAFGVDV